jgi:NAD(P)-dependent dehydrogenase (short-subunit alcohol dehydrogenase family)
MNVFLTGANRGIGLALARQYSLGGHNVIAACRQASKELQELPLTVLEGFEVTDRTSLAYLA